MENSQGVCHGVSEHLQFFLLFREARRQQRPHGVTLREKQWDNMEDLLKATAFIQATGPQTLHLL